MFFNLIVSGNDTWWDKEYCKFSLDRLFEYSDDSTRTWLSPITSKVNIRELEGYPTLLAYEYGVDKPARLVSLKNLRISNRELIFQVEDRNDFSTVFGIYDEPLRSKLRIDDDFEPHRTHWAVKEGDLLDILKDFRLTPANPTKNPGQNMQSSSRVFVVHGHDEGALQSVARFLETIGLTPVILREQADGGKTIIEKFEHHAEQASFAVVLLTPDDVGGASARPTQNHRARQNVILELGYFVGTLGRSRVCALKKGTLELPNDILGVLWKEMDPQNGWKLELAKELKHAGLPVDLARLV